MARNDTHEIVVSASESGEGVVTLYCGFCSEGEGVVVKICKLYGIHGSVEGEVVQSIQAKFERKADMLVARAVFDLSDLAPGSYSARAIFGGRPLHTSFSVALEMEQPNTLRG